MKYIEHRFTAMGGPCRLRMYCADELTQRLTTLAEQEVERLEAIYSRYRPDSLVSRMKVHTT